MRPYHPRVIANHLLDLADGHSRPVTNMALQKLLYYAHGWSLASSGQPLVRGGFQAWEFGPVSRTVYSAFRVAGERPIDFRATVVNMQTGQEVVAAAPIVAVDSKLLNDVFLALGHLHPFELSRRTHEAGSPWHQVWTSQTVVPGMQIEDELIREHFLDSRFAVRN